MPGLCLRPRPSQQRPASILEGSTPGLLPAPGCRPQPRPPALPGSPQHTAGMWQGFGKGLAGDRVPEAGPEPGWGGRVDTALLLSISVGPTSADKAGWEQMRSQEGACQPLVGPVTSSSLMSPTARPVPWPVSPPSIPCLPRVSPCWGREPCLATHGHAQSPSASRCRAAVPPPPFLVSGALRPPPSCSRA